MTKREHIQWRRLESLKFDFFLLLPRLLKQCAAGRLGLFGRNEHVRKASYLPWPEAEQLKSMADKINSISHDLGTSNREVDLFSYYCSLRGANVPGEPKLAQAMLREVETSRFRRAPNVQQL